MWYNSVISPLGNVLHQEELMRVRTELFNVNQTSNLFVYLPVIKGNSIQHIQV